MQSYHESGPSARDPQYRPKIQESTANTSRTDITAKKGPMDPEPCRELIKRGCWSSGKGVVGVVPAGRAVFIAKSENGGIGEEMAGTSEGGVFEIVG